MSDKSAIAWCDATWNVLVGCTKAIMPGANGKLVLRQGCANCYAIRISATPRLQQFEQYKGIVTIDKDRRPEWTGKINFVDSAIEKPLHWRKPKRIFVNAFADLFHEDVPLDWIIDILCVMAEASWHTFIVLTKRPERMQRILAGLVSNGAPGKAPAMPWPASKRLVAFMKNYGGVPALPLPNVIWGVSIEDQESADHAVPYLLETPAACRMVSAEPLLADVDLRMMTTLPTEVSPIVLTPENSSFGIAGGPPSRINWVVVGGESGPEARPMEQAWALSLRQQCMEAGVPFFFKQGSQANWKHWRESDLDKFPAALRVRDYPNLKGLHHA